jgi:hypothetical protein
MRPSLSDTNPKIEDIQINLMRKMNIRQKFSLIKSLSSLTISLSKRAIARRKPKLSKLEQDLLFVKYNYGEDLYKKVRGYLLKLPHNDM